MCELFRQFQGLWFQESLTHRAIRLWSHPPGLLDLQGTDTLYTRPFLKFSNSPLKRKHVSHLWKWIVLGRRFWASVFLGANKSKKPIFKGHFGSFWEGYNGRRVRSITYTPLTPNPVGRMEDHDGVLRAEEITAYVKGEHHFDLAEERWNDDGFVYFFSI